MHPWTKLTAVVVIALAHPGPAAAQAPAEAPAAPRLELSGFVDLLAQAPAPSNRFFRVGGLELDLAFTMGKRYGTSVALTWGGDGGAEIAVAVLDYHVSGERAPSRGPIFEEPGFHVQAGRFDLPFGVDYEVFAAPDRPNVTAPLTTALIQDGGFNGDGARIYGSLAQLTYALYLIDSIYRDGGVCFGAHASFLPGHDPYRLHRPSALFVEVGLSYLGDASVTAALREHNVGGDVTVRLGWLALVAEVIWHRSIDPGSSRPRDELAYYTALTADLARPLDVPLTLFVRFDQWHPGFATRAVAVDDLYRVSAAAAWAFNDHFTLKLELFDHLDAVAGRLGLDRRLAMLQAVAGF